MRYVCVCEEKIKGEGKNRWIKKCWLEKENMDWKNVYSKEKYYNKNEWGIEILEDLRKGDLREELIPF